MRRKGCGRISRGICSRRQRCCLMCRFFFPFFPSAESGKETVEGNEKASRISGLKA